MKTKNTNLICIIDDKNGFIVITPYSTTYCDTIDDVCDDIEEFLVAYMEVKNEKQKKRP